MEYYLAIKKRNEIMLFAATWMDPEIEKDKYIGYLVESKKMTQMNLFTKQK